MEQPAPSLSVMSLNIEGKKHFDRFLPELQRIRPDVLCVQELFEDDVAILEERLGMKSVYAPITHIPQPDGTTKRWGVALFSGMEFLETDVIYYAGDGDNIPTFIKGDADSYCRALVTGEVERGSVRFIVATTHFTWTPNGEADDHQRKDIRALMGMLSKIPEFVLLGDFNAPRGRETFAILAERYKDNIPLDITTTIDATLHRAGDLQYVVDGFFSTPGYSVREVEVRSGLSDHCGIIGRVSGK